MDVERTMQFILEQQAATAAKSGEHEERMATLERKMADLTTLVHLVVESHVQSRQELREFREGVEEFKTWVKESIANLQDGQAVTTEKLNALIQIVDEMIRKPRTES